MNQYGKGQIKNKTNMKLAGECEAGDQSQPTQHITRLVLSWNPRGNRKQPRICGSQR